MDTPLQTSTASCANCGSPDVRIHHVRSAFWQDDRLVVVQDIPALVCGACAEHFYADTTVVGLDLLRGEGFPADMARTELSVPVFSYGDRKRAKVEP